MKVTSSRRSSNRKSTSIYSRPKTYDPSSDASEPESEDSLEETTKTEEAYYQSEDEEMDELEDLLQDEEEEEEEEEEIEVEQEEEEENEQVEDDVDVEAEEEMDDGDATPVDDDEFDEEEDEEESEEEEEEQSDYEEVQSRRSRSRTTQKTPSKPKQASKSKQKEPQVSDSLKKRTSMAESSSPTPENRILTKRQRAKLNENYEQDLLQLPMEPMKKKQLTEEEIQLKKSEIARRRKNQSIQRAEQDKMDTINRLLKKQGSKKRSKDQDDNDSVHNNDNGSSTSIPNVFHYVVNQEGCSLSVPRGVNIPIEFSKGPKYPPPVPICSFSGCQLPKKYRSTKTFEFACSMEHLRKINAQT